MPNISDYVKEEDEVFVIVSNTRILLFNLDKEEKALVFQIFALYTDLTESLDLIVPLCSDNYFRKFLLATEIKTGVAYKAKEVLDEFGHFQVSNATYLNEQDFDQFVCKNIWPGFNYSSTKLASPIYYLPKDDIGNTIHPTRTQQHDANYYNHVIRLHYSTN